ncbi:MAG: hypothetical protein EOM52_10195 [Clostridia bacterium]|jgi:hypothetical protein|nr:hypothetical protein [Clostridia bacterium]
MPEEKYRFPLRLTPEVQRMVKEAMPHDNSQSQNEYIEKAIRFYSGYLMTKDSTEYLTPTLVESLRGTLDSFGAHINRSLFRLCVENAIMENILAAGLEMRDDELMKLRARCIAEVKRTNGRLSFEDNLRFQQGEDMD